MFHCCDSFIICCSIGTLVAEVILQKCKKLGITVQWAVYNGTCIVLAWISISAQNMFHNDQSLGCEMNFKFHFLH